MEYLLTSIATILDSTRRPKIATFCATATEEYFDIKISRQSASIGLPLLFPLSLSSKTETDEQVKPYGETVTDKKFYERFYQAVQRELGK